MERNYDISTRFSLFAAQPFPWMPELEQTGKLVKLDGTNGKSL